MRRAARWATIRAASKRSSRRLWHLMWYEQSLALYKARLWNTDGLS